MELSKAIEILEAACNHEERFDQEELWDAQKLGIQAMIRVENDRTNPGAYRHLPLQNETPPKKETQPMELSKAIELLSDSANRGVTTFDQDYKDAQKLGIEAMIAIQAWRRDWNANRFHLLPHETPPVTSDTPAKLIDLHY